MSSAPASEPWVHPTAIVEDGVELGAGTRVWDGAHLRHGARLGESCIVGEKTYVAYDVVITETSGRELDRDRNCVGLFLFINFFSDLVGRIAGAGLEVAEFRVREPGLHGVFLHLTGREFGH